MNEIEYNKYKNVGLTWGKIKMEKPGILISTISPEKGKKINAVDKHSKYIIKILAPKDLSEALFDYAECFLKQHTR